MNTTSLIQHWSMSGARRDLAGRFRATDDIHALLLGETTEKAPARSPAPLLVKPAGEGGWEPLLVGGADNDS